MKPEQRKRVVELLRATAASPDTIHEHVHRDGVDFSDSEGEIAEIAREAAQDAWEASDEPDDDLSGDDYYNETCRRAAKLVEDGWSPP